MGQAMIYNGIMEALIAFYIDTVMINGKN
jgi:hypothetical protein